MSIVCSCKESSACVNCFDSVCMTHSCLVKKDYFLNQHRPLLCETVAFLNQEPRATLKMKTDAERTQRNQALAVYCSCGGLACFLHFYTYRAYCWTCKSPEMQCIYIEGLSPVDFRRHVEFWFSIYCQERNWPYDPSEDTNDLPSNLLLKKQSHIAYNRRNFTLPVYRCSMTDCDCTTADSEMAAITRSADGTTRYCLQHTQLMNIQSIAGGALLCEYKREMLFSNLGLRKMFSVLFFEDPAIERDEDSGGNRTSFTSKSSFACSLAAPLTGVCFAVLAPGIELLELEDLVVNGQRIDFDLRTKERLKIKACFPQLSDSNHWEISVKMHIYAIPSQRHPIRKSHDFLYIGSDGSIWSREQNQFPVQVMELEYQCCSTS